MTVEQLNLALLVGAGVVLLAVAAVRLSHGSGLPTLLAYLALGLAIGERGAGIRFDDARLTELLGYSALVLILVEGGMTTRWATIRPSVAPAAVLATLGTTVSVAVAGAAAHYLLALDWVTALLLGAMISSTDAAAVFSVLRRLPLPPRLVGVLEAESGFNDAPVVIAVVALTAASKIFDQRRARSNNEGTLFIVHDVEQGLALDLHGAYLITVSRGDVERAAWTEDCHAAVREVHRIRPAHRGRIGPGGQQRRRGYFRIAGPAPYQFATHQQCDDGRGAESHGTPAARPEFPARAGVERPNVGLSQ